MRTRPASEADFPSIYELFREADRGAYGHVDQTEEEVRLWLTSPKVKLDRDVRLAVDGDRLVGYADVDRQEGEPPRWWCDVRLHPDADPDVVFDELLWWIEDRVDGGLVRLWAPSVARQLAAAFERRGFRRIRSSYRMEIDLGQELEEAVLADGLVLRTLEPGEERVAYRVHQESFEDSWEHTPEPYEEWEHYLVATESFDPSLWFVVWDGNEPAGAAICRVRDGSGWIGILGVRRAWRRRGIGRALLLHAFHEFRRRGLERAGLGVDAESLTGANRLYEAVGMRVSRQLEFFERELSRR